MAKFCNKECEDRGSICDFCLYYKDEYRDILKLKNKNGNILFAGNGMCEITKEDTLAIDGFNCNNFKCFNIGDD